MPVPAVACWADWSFSRSGARRAASRSSGCGRFSSVDFWSVHDSEEGRLMMAVSIVILDPGSLELVLIAPPRRPGSTARDGSS